ncbi:MAG TPA: Rap1a/Tai family immunity protein [Parvibaculum sp.]|jgi:hypothetical protein
MYLSIRSGAAAAFTAIALTIMTPTEGFSTGTSRISTGQDLYEACRALADHGLTPETPTPRRGLYCRQFIAGYFATLKYVHDDHGAKEALGVPLYASDCIDIAGPRSYEQLATKVVRSAEWHPELMGQPAIDLMRSAFGSSPPCGK